jgi:hypothetical protein
MKIVPKGEYLLKLWFPDMESLTKYWRLHKEVSTLKHTEVNITDMEYEGEKGFSFAIK